MSLYEAVLHTSKMKFLLVLVALLGASWAAPPTRSLQEDLQQIVAMIPIDEMREVARRYAIDDAEFQSVVAYLQGDEWRGVVDAVSEREDWQEFKAYMLENGIDIVAIAEAIRNMIAGVELPSKKGQRSVRDFVDEVLALVDLEGIQNLINELLATSPDFQEFSANVSSDEARQMVAEIRAIPEVQYMSQRLRDLGIDVDRVIAFLETLLGWE